MHVHPPKPVHGWRAFLGEVGVIVVGILIALGLEQVVETVRHREQAAEAREAIEGEIAGNLRMMGLRARVQDCIDRRLDEIGALIVAPASTKALPRPLWIGRPQIWEIGEVRLTAATSAARTALLTADQQGDYGELYALARQFDAAQDVEQQAWARLRALEILPRVDDASRWALTEALQQARYANFMAKVSSVQSRRNAEEIGVKEAAPTNNLGSRSVCIPTNTPREKALQMTGRPLIAEP
jgi:uncharacterized protein with GYD domain